MNIFEKIKNIFKRKNTEFLLPEGNPQQEMSYNQYQQYNPYQQQMNYNQYNNISKIHSITFGDSNLGPSNTIRRDNVAFTSFHNGLSQVDFINMDNTSNFRRGYDSTRLQINFNNYQIINGHTVYPAKVSWYKENDPIGFDSKDPRSTRHRFSDIMIQVDPQLLYNDASYIETLMTSLLEKNRVTDRLSKSLKDEEHCGNYMGGVSRNENNCYTKFIDGNIANQIHNSPKMTEQRNNYNEQLKQVQANKQISLENQIAQLKAQLDNMQMSK